MNLPNLLERPDALRSVANARRPGVILDFDGTLSEIAPTPDAAVIHPRAAEALSRIVERYALVAILSGRAARDVESRVAPRATPFPPLQHLGGEGWDGGESAASITYVGNHGAESIDGGELRVLAPPPDGIPRILAHLRAAMGDAAGIVYEDKRFSASVHYRLAPDPSDAERRLRRTLDDARDAVRGLDELRWFWGRMVLEIRPRAAVNKGDAIAELAERHRLDALIFVGDDTTDVDGMRRLSSIDGVKAVGVAVLSDETPAALLDAADYAVRGVEEVAEVLELLAGLAGG